MIESIIGTRNNINNNILYYFFEKFQGDDHILSAFFLFFFIFLLTCFFNYSVDKDVCDIWLALIDKMIIVYTTICLLSSLLYIFWYVSWSNVYCRCSSFFSDKKKALARDGSNCSVCAYSLLSMSKNYWYWMWWWQASCCIGSTITSTGYEMGVALNRFCSVICWSCT